MESIGRIFKSFEQKAELAVKSRLYSPKQDETRLAKMTSKLAESKSGISELAVGITETAVRLHSFYNSRMERLKAEQLSREMFQTLTDVLKRVGSGNIDLAGRDKSLVGTLAGYWNDVATRDTQAKESASEDIAQAYIDKGDYDEAYRVLQVTLETKAKAGDKAGMVPTLRSIADIMKRKGNLKEALDYSRKAAEINPLAWFDVGLVLGKMNQYEECIAAYTEFLKVAPEDASAWNNKGWAYENLSDLPKALECYERALEYNSKLALSWIGKGSVLWKLGEPVQAASAMDEALRIDPNNQYVLTNLTALYNDALKNYEKAAAYAQRAFGVNPNDLSARSNLAESLVTVGRYKEAREHANKVLKSGDNWSRKLAMYFVLSSSYFLEGDTKNGTKYLKALEDYRTSLPSTFINEWGYDGISDFLAKSNIPEDYKAKLFKAINAINTIVPQ